MRATVLLGCVLLAGCGNGEGDKLRLLDRDYDLGPGASDGQGFVVYGDAHALVEVHVTAPETGEGVDVSFLLDGKPLEHLSAHEVRGKKIISGDTPGDAYEVKVRNRDAKNAIKVHVAVVRDFSR